MATGRAEAAGRWLGAARRGDAGARLRVAVVAAAAGAGVALLAVVQAHCDCPVAQAESTLHYRPLGGT